MNDKRGNLYVAATTCAGETYAIKMYSVGVMDDALISRAACHIDNTDDKKKDVCVAYRHNCVANTCFHFNCFPCAEIDPR